MFAEKKEKMTEQSKAILDKWATLVVPKDAVFLDDKGDARVNQEKTFNYTSDKYSEDIVLWTAPLNSIRVEFEDTPEQCRKYITTCEAQAKSMNFDYCITEHKGAKSPYFNMFNLPHPKNLMDWKSIKLLLIDMLLTDKVKTQLDRTNLGFTLTPVIGHQHWKPKYNGSVHEVIRGKNPLEQDNSENEILKEIIKKVEKSRTKITKGLTSLRLSNNKWVEDFLLNYCCNVPLPKGNRHSVICKNLAILIAHKEERELYIEKFSAIQNMSKNEVLVWITSCLSGQVTEVSPGELLKYIQENKLGYEIPKDLVNEKPYQFAMGLNSFTDFPEIARNFIRVQPIYFDNSRIWWIWNLIEYKWEMIDEIDLMIHIDNELKNSMTVKANIKSEIIESLKREGRKNRPKKTPPTLIQFQNELVDIVTGDRFKASPNYFVTNPIPHKLGTIESVEKIEKLFEEWVGKENVIVLYEIMAYCLLSDYPIHRIFCFVGSGLNGKGTYMKLLKRFIGLSNTTSTDLDVLMSNRFESAKLYKKLVCLMGETNFSEMRKTSLIKKLCGEDLIGFEFKNKDPFDDHNYAKLIISTNSLPMTSDKTIGFYRRWYLIDFPRQFSEKEDVLVNITEEDMEALALKCLNILKELYIRREFTNEGSIEERQKRYEFKSNPMEKFLEQEVEQDSCGIIFKYEFRDRFMVWLKQHNFRIWSEHEIGSEMKKRYDEGRREAEDEKRYFAWLGVSWKKTNENLIQKTIENSCVKDVKDVNLVLTPPCIRENSDLDIGRHPRQPYHDTFLNDTSILNICKNEISTTEIVSHFGINHEIEIIEKLSYLRKKGEIINPKPDFWVVTC